MNIYNYKDVNIYIDSNEIQIYNGCDVDSIHLKISESAYRTLVDSMLPTVLSKRYCKSELDTWDGLPDRFSLSYSSDVIEIIFYNSPLIYVSGKEDTVSIEESNHRNTVFKESKILKELRLK